MSQTYLSEGTVILCEHLRCYGYISWDQALKLKQHKLPAIVNILSKAHIIKPVYKHKVRYFEPASVGVTHQLIASLVTDKEAEKHFKLVRWHHILGYSAAACSIVLTLILGYNRWWLIRNVPVS